MAKKKTETKKAGGESAAKDMPRFFIPSKPQGWVGGYAGVGLEFHLTDEESGENLRFVLCGADYRLLIDAAKRVLAELEQDNEDTDD